MPLKTSMEIHNTSTGMALKKMDDSEDLVTDNTKSV